MPVCGNALPFQDGNSRLRIIHRARTPNSAASRLRKGELQQEGPSETERHQVSSQLIRSWLRQTTGHVFLSHEGEMPACRPPVIKKSDPVVNSLASLKRYVIIGVRSDGLPFRFTGAALFFHPKSAKAPTSRPRIHSSRSTHKHLFELRILLLHPSRHRALNHTRTNTIHPHPLLA